CSVSTKPASNQKSPSLSKGAGFFYCCFRLPWSNGIDCHERCCLSFAHRAMRLCAAGCCIGRRCHCRLLPPVCLPLSTVGIAVLRLPLRAGLARLLAPRKGAPD